MIDWSKPAYARPVKRGTHHFTPCDICGERIQHGQMWHRGPRGRTGVHAECRAKLLDQG